VSELRFDQVTVRFGTGRKTLTAVDGVELTIPSGQVVGLVGESGSGKSTLGRAAVGLTPLSGGNILLDGKPLRRRGRRQPLQMVFQDPYSSLDPRMTIGDTIAETIPRSEGRRRLERRREVARLLELVDLDPDRAQTYPAQLSGGQRQRVALARALAARPEVIIADEITSALDVSIQGTVLNLVRDLQKSLELSMLFISHNLASVRYVSDVIAVMYLGRIIEYGPAEQILHDPHHPYTRDLLAAAPDPNSATLTEDVADPALQIIADTEPPDPHHPPAGCHYHPRCPIGPLISPDRTDCLTTSPTTDHANHAACHYAGQREAAVTS
jgi:peptide/nickel transport system ATP-binding protein